jgi:2-dehydropantoate 2-reductase
VPVNNYQLETVLGELSPKLKKAQFLIMTSNWNGTGVFDKVLSPDRYLLGYPDGGGTFQDGGMLANLGASIHLGEKDGRPSPRLQMLVDLLKKADMTPDVPPNILHWLWIHNATSATFYAGLCKYRDIRSFIKDGAMLSDCFIASKECLDLCRKRGVDIEKYDDISYFKYPIWVCTLIFRALFTFNKSMQVYTAHAASEGSKKEMRGNFMEIYNSGKSLGVPMPTMDKLYSIIASS